MHLPASRAARFGIYTVALAALWSVPCLMVTSQLAIDARLMHRPIDPFAVFREQLLRWWIWIPLTPAVIAFTRRIGRRPVPHLLFILGISLITTAAWTLQGYANGGFKDRPVILFQLFYPVSLNWTLLSYLAIAGISMAADGWRRAAELQKQLGEARLIALTRQLQPHFLFNTLHSIAGLVRANRGPEAVETVARLSELLRESLDAEQAPEVELGREMQASDLYLEIQRTRFSDRMRVVRDLAPETLSALVPRFILQPLLENAVNHGIAAHPEPGTITIRAARRAGQLVIGICNTGPALPVGWSIDTAAHVGLRNTQERLRQLYDGKAWLSLGNSPAGGVKAEIGVPWKRT